MFFVDIEMNKVFLENKSITYYICYENKQNIFMSKYLSGKNIEHIKVYDFVKNNITVKKHICIANVGDKYKLYIKLKKKVDSENLMYIATYIVILIADIIIVNKVSNIDKGLRELDIALDLGKDVYAIPGDIFDYQSYLANFAIKQGAIPICSRYDMKYILKEKKFNVL